MERNYVRKWMGLLIDISWLLILSSYLVIILAFTALEVSTHDGSWVYHLYHSGFECLKFSRLPPTHGARWRCALKSLLHYMSLILGSYFLFFSLLAL